MNKTITRNKSNRTEVAKRVRTTLSFSIPALLLTIVSLMVLIGTFTTPTPCPLVPPNGYTAYEKQVLLVWNFVRGDGEYHLKVAIDGEYSSSFIDLETSKNEFLLSGLELGKRYCWRVEKENGAGESCFHTADTASAY